MNSTAEAVGAVWRRYGFCSIWAMRMAQATVALRDSAVPPRWGMVTGWVTHSLTCGVRPRPSLPTHKAAPRVPLALVTSGSAATVFISITAFGIEAVWYRSAV